VKSPTYPHPAPHTNGYRPSIEIMTGSGEDPQGFGTVSAFLHVTAHYAILLREYDLEGPPCEHLGDLPSHTDNKEVEKLVTCMRLTARALGIHLKLDKHGINGLLYPTAE
jgi:hypothetical protein